MLRLVVLWQTCQAPGVWASLQGLAGYVHRDWLSCQASGVWGSTLGLADYVSSDRDWLSCQASGGRWSKLGLACCVSTPWLGEAASLIYIFSASQHVPLSEQTRPRYTEACCWWLKQPANDNNDCWNVISKERRKERVIVGQRSLPLQVEREFGICSHDEAHQNKEQDEKHPKCLRGF